MFKFIFKFKCSNKKCGKTYRDDCLEQTKKTMESECPHCGTWNYAKKPEKKLVL